MNLNTIPEHAREKAAKIERLFNERGILLPQEPKINDEHVSWHVVVKEWDISLWYNMDKETLNLMFCFDEGCVEIFITHSRLEKWELQVTLMNDRRKKPLPFGLEAVMREFLPRRPVTNFILEAVEMAQGGKPSDEINEPDVLRFIVLLLRVILMDH